MYPVEVAYLSEPSSDYVESAVQAVFDIHAKVSLARRMFFPRANSLTSLD